MLRTPKLPRPDNQLKRCLLLLSYALVLLTFVIGAFLIYKSYLPLNVGVISLTVICLMLTIFTLHYGEEALSYGGFANEMISKNSSVARIDNLEGEPVIQNDLARDFFVNAPILQFLQERLSDSSKSNEANFVKLQIAVQKLKTEKVDILLKINGEEKCYTVSVTPLFLRKIDIFEGSLKINRVKNDVYIFWALDDVTAEKNIEQVFFEERKYLHDFLDFLPVGLYTCNKDYKIEYANEVFAGMLGSSVSKLKNKNLKNFVLKDCDFYNAPANYQGFSYFNGGGKTVESFVVQDNVRENKETKIRGVVMPDLPNDQALSLALYNAECKVNWFFDNAPVGIALINKKGIIINCNHKSSLIFLKSSEEIINKNIFDFIKSADEVDAFKKSLSYIENNNSEVLFTDVHISSGGKEKILRVYTSLMKKLHSAKEAVGGFVLYFIDATEQKNLELQFAQAQKMQAMGQLAGGVAHDFNNLLTSMIGFCDLLLQKHGIGDPSFSDLIQIKQNANRAAGLVRQLLAFSRKQPLKPKLIDVTENFVDLNLMLKRILGEQVNLKFYHGQNLGFIRVDPVQFSQVIINLAVNAKDAMNGVGSLNISSRVERVKENFRFGDNEIVAGDFVAIDIEDTGCGISEENLSRIFEPFFSTKQNIVGSGTGLGLSMVYGIVQQTKGFIKVKSQLGKGTVFSIYLPRFDSDTEGDSPEDKTSGSTINRAGAIGVNQKMILGINVAAVDKSRGKSSDSNDVNIIFTEDEDSIRTFAVRALKKKGFNVISCNSAENTLEQLKENHNFQVLITDMMMPGMNGAELAKEVRKIIPDIKIILASGYSEEIAHKGLKSDEVFDFIAKPYSLADLTQKVFEVLNK